MVRNSIDLDAITKDVLKSICKIVSESVPRTPVVRMGPDPGFRYGSCFVKCENLTPSGSFKIRGASFFLSRYKTVRGGGGHLFAASTGNHGISLALLTSKANIETTIVVPEGTPRRKKDLLHHYGATVCEIGHSLDDSLVAAQQLAKDRGGVFLDSCHPDLIAGHTSLGAELVEQASDIDVLFFPIGVGAGISAMLIALKEASPNIQVIGVVPSTSPGWFQSWKAKEPISVPVTSGLADGLRTTRPNPELFRRVVSQVSDIVMVTEENILSALEMSQRVFGVKVEPTGVVGLAALLEYCKSEACAKGANVATVLCGGQLYSKPMLK